MRWSITLPIWLAMLGTGLGTLCAGINEWSNVGPNGGAVRLTIDPQDPNTFYAGTGTGLFKSNDRGASWSAAGLIGWDVTNLLIDPQNTSTRYAQTAFYPDEDSVISKVFKSTDGGATWNDLVTGATLLAIDPQDSGTLYAFVGGGQPQLFKSPDGGATWARLSGLPANLYFFGLAIDPQNHNTLYAPVQGTSAGRNVATVFKSKDGGASWNESASGLPATFSLDGVPNALMFAPGGLTIDPKNPSTLYATKFAAGVYKTTDGGASWRAANSGMPNNPLAFPTCCISGAVIDPQNPGTLYAVALNDVLYKTTNGGTNWRPVSSGLWPGLLAPGANSLTVDPQDSSTVYAATGIGLFRSTDGGANFDRYSWPRATPISTLAIDPLTPGTLYAGGQKSMDAGTSWFAANSGIPQGGIVALAIDPKTPATVYAATNAYECGTGSRVGIYKSVDGGTNWADTRSGIGCGLTAVVVDPQDPGTVYAGSLYRGVYKSMDGGASWIVMNSGLPSVGPGPNVNALAVDPKNSGTLYASAASGLFKTTDGAASWSRTGLTSGASALAIDPQNTGTLYAVTSNGLFKSTDGGASWGNLSPPSSTNAYAVAINPQSPSTVYAGTETGVAQSTDGGESWTGIPGGPANVRVLALDPQAPNTVYAGGPGGLFAISLDPTGLRATRTR